MSNGCGVSEKRIQGTWRAVWLPIGAGAAEADDTRLLWRFEGFKSEVSTGSVAGSQPVARSRSQN